MNDDNYDETLCKDISLIIRDICDKNYKLVKDDDIRKLRSICDDSGLYVRRVYDILLRKLETPHSEARYNAFYTLNIFFKNYYEMRRLVTDNLKPILRSATNIDFENRLPPPAEAALELNSFALKCIEEWTAAFGSSFIKLDLCYKFLSSKKRVDFKKLSVEDEATARRSRELSSKRQKFSERKLRSLRNEINEAKSEIENLRLGLDSCLKLLIPTPEQFFIGELTGDVNSESFDDGESYETNVDEESFREAGVLRSFSLNVDLPAAAPSVTIVETDENSVIIENAKDGYKLLSKKYRGLVKNWVKDLSSLSDDSKEIREAIELKTNVESAIRKFEILKFEKSENDSIEDESGSETEMLVVATDEPTADERLIANLKDGAMSTSSSFHFSSKCDVEPESRVRANEISDRKTRLLEIAPKLPFDVDLYHWEDEDEQLTVPTLLPVSADGRKFWSATDVEYTDGIAVPEGVASLRTRVIEFAGQFKPVKWSCRFPLSNGKLCPRKDRIKCPFHGTIVARDEYGKCLDPENAEKDRLLALRLSRSEAQNPTLLAEIKLQTGVDLRLSKKKRENEAESLTNVKTKQNTVYRRLEKKLFRKSTIKKVAKTLDNLDNRRFKDKFGDQFQYVHETV